MPLINPTTALLLGYLVFMPLLAWFLQRREKGSLEGYFIGNRSIGLFSLAMTMAAFYSNASSFIAGPGAAYNFGLSWVFIATVQYPFMVLILGLIAPRIRTISQRINAWSLTDLFHYRYGSKFYTGFIGWVTVFSLFVMLVVGLIAGGKILSVTLRSSYFIGLLLFSVAMMVYTVLGGFKTVVLTDIFQGIIMLIAIITLLIVGVHFFYNDGNSWAKSMERVREASPHLFTVDSGGVIPKGFILSFIILVGVGLLAHPSLVLYCIAMKENISLSQTIFIGTIVQGIFIFVTHFIGFMGNGILPLNEGGEEVIIYLSSHLLTPFFHGVFIGGAIAAITSSLDSILILIIQTLTRDIFRGVREWHEGRQYKLGHILGGALCLIAFTFALYPPSLLIQMNLYSLGIIESALFAPFILGLLWKRGNLKGAWAGSLLGLISFVLLQAFFLKGFSVVHPIVVALGVSLIGYIFITFITKQNLSEERLEQYFE